MTNPGKYWINTYRNGANFGWYKPGGGAGAMTNLEWARRVVGRKEEIARRRGELLARWEPEEEAKMMTRERYEKLMVQGMDKQPEASGRYRWCQVVRTVLSDAERAGLGDKVILEGLDVAAALVGVYLTAK